MDAWRLVLTAAEVGSGHSMRSETLLSQTSYWSVVLVRRDAG